MTKMPFATGVSSASLHSCYSITNGARINWRGLSHVQSPSTVKSPSDSISGRHCWVMINVVTGARGGVLLLRGTFWPGEVPACFISRKIIGRTAGPGFGFVRHRESTRTKETARPRKEAATAMPNSIRAKVLHLHARCSISQTTDTCASRRIRADPSAEYIH